ncbi:hypothetical protein BV379_12350 [Rhodovulum sulfidophilum]|nr:hypothetical protein BV379_12350 [Rhodovulum sulfidophilum]
MAANRPAATPPSRRPSSRKHGGPKQRVWRMVHLGIDKETLEALAVEITGSHIGDAPMLPELLDKIPPEQEIGSVTADGAYDRGLFMTPQRGDGARIWRTPRCRRCPGDVRGEVAGLRRQ